MEWRDEPEMPGSVLRGQAKPDLGFLVKVREAVLSVKARLGTLLQDLAKVRPVDLAFLEKQSERVLSESVKPGTEFRAKPQALLAAQVFGVNTKAMAVALLALVKAESAFLVKEDDSPDFLKVMSK